jgi:DNA-binding NtrC family response regulator
MWLASNLGAGAQAACRMLTVGLTARNARDLEMIVRPCQWDIRSALTCNDAALTVRTSAPAIVLFDADSGDDWRTLWRDVSAMRQPPLFILATRTADDALWAEALNLGIYDVIATPFRLEEVVRTLHSASMFSQQVRSSAPSAGRICHYCG